VLADDVALIGGLVGADEEDAARLEVAEGVAYGFARAVGDDLTGQT
jgi:hypothetical protein